MSEPGVSSDNTASNNVEMRCSNGQVLSVTASSWGSWSTWVDCPPGKAITGVHVQIQENQNTADDTSVNQINFKCETPGTVWVKINMSKNTFCYFYAY